MHATQGADEVFTVGGSDSKRSCLAVHTLEKMSTTLSMRFR